MADASIDLRELLLWIKDKKALKTNLSLEFDCIIETEDPKPLVKVINYILNYLNQITSEAIQISLNAQTRGILLGFSAFTSHSDLPPLTEQIHEALKSYNATMEVVFEAEKFVQLSITFTK